MSDSYGQGGDQEGDPSYGGSDSPPPPPSPPGGPGYPPPGQGGYPPPPGQGGYPPPPGQGGYPPPSYPGTYGQPGQPSQYPPGPGQQPYGAGHGSAYPGGAWDSERPRGWSGLAIAAFVVGLLVPCIGLLVAVPLGIVALIQIRKTGDKGKAFAVLGIVLPVVWLAIFGGIIAWFASTEAERNDAGDIVEAGRLSLTDVRIGDCLMIDGLDDASQEEVGAFDVDGVPCDEGHNAETAATIPIPGADYPGESAVLRLADRCQIELRQYLGQGFASYSIYPPEDVWDDEGGDRILCFVVRSDYGEMTGRQVPQ